MPKRWAMTSLVPKRPRLFAAGGQDLMRHPGDLFRVLLGSIALAGSAVVVLGGQVGRFEANLFRLVNDLPAALALPLMGIMQAGAFPAVPVVAGLAYIARRSRLAWDLAAAGTLAYGLARLIKLLILRERPGAYLEQVVIRGAEAIGLGYPSGHVAVASALATAAGPYLSLWTRRVAWIVVALVAVARIYVGAHLPVDVLGGAALGWTIGAAWHLVWGAPRSAPAPELIVAALQRAQVDPIDLRPLRVDARGSTPYVVQTAGGTELFVKSVGREQRTADVLFKAWRWLLFREVEDEAPFATPKQQIEHEAYIALLAERTGVCTPRIVCATALSDGSALLAQARVVGRGLDTLPADALDGTLLRRIWQQVALLRRARIAHRDLRRANILIDARGQPWIIDFGFAEGAASDRRLAQDVAETLASLATLVGAERATTAALDVLGGEAVLEALPLLQPLALGGATRHDLRSHPGVLTEVRDLVVQRTGVPAPPVVPLTRVRLRTVLGLVGAAVAIHLLLPQVGEVRQTVEALRTVRWPWVLLGAVGSALTYVMAAVALLGTVDQPLALGRTIAVQVAGSFLNRLTPQGLGGLGANERYLERTGIERPVAVAAVTLNAATGVIVHLLGLLVAAVAVGSSGVVRVRIPRGWPALIALVTMLVLLGLAVWSPRGRRLVVMPGLQAGRRLVAVLRQPVRAVQLVGGSAGITGAYAFTLAASVYAYGGHTALLTISAVYLAGAAVAAASPTPGGLGAIEAALVAGLTTVGEAAATAVTGVLTFRLLTFWLPIIPGFLALRYVQHRRWL